MKYFEKRTSFFSIEKSIPPTKMRRREQKSDIFTVYRSKESLKIILKRGGNKKIDGRQTVKQNQTQAQDVKFQQIWMPQVGLEKLLIEKKKQEYRTEKCPTKELNGFLWN